MRIGIKAYSIGELARMEGKDNRTIKSKPDLYIPVIISDWKSKKSKKGYTVRYIRKKDIRKTGH